MTDISTALFAAAAVVSISTSAYAQQHHHGQAGSMDPAAMQQMMKEMQPEPSDSPFVKAFKEAHAKMMRDMHMKLTGNPDLDFARGMIPHHEGAIDMAKLQLAHGKDPQLRKMAEQIIKDQEKEIGELQAWLKKNPK